MQSTRPRANVSSIIIRQAKINVIYPWVLRTQYHIISRLLPKLTTAPLTKILCHKSGESPARISSRYRGRCHSHDLVRDEWVDNDYIRFSLSHGPCHRYTKAAS